MDRFEPVVFYDDDVAVPAMQQDKNGRYMRYSDMVIDPNATANGDTQRAMFAMIEENKMLHKRLAEAERWIAQVRKDYVGASRYVDEQIRRQDDAARAADSADEVQK